MSDTPDLPKHIFVNVYQEILPFHEDKGLVWRVTDHVKDNVAWSKWYNADQTYDPVLVRELIELVKDNEFYRGGKWFELADEIIAKLEASHD